MTPPDEPGNTCPLIDYVVDDLKTLQEVEAKSCVVFDGVSLDQCLKKMEEIRTANSDLRERAEFFEQQAGEFEEARDEAVAKTVELEIELKATEVIEI